MAELVKQAPRTLSQSVSLRAMNIQKNTTLHLKDPGSAITHFIGAIMAVSAAPFLLLKSYQTGGLFHLASMSIFVLGLVLLYTASTVYHSFDISEQANRILRKIDHMMIFVLIAGTYTPVCMIVLPGFTGYALCALVWGIAIFGILIKAFWITCPKWFSSVIYIGMGWVCVLAFTKILAALSPAAFGWLLAGGIIYTIGGIIYALKLPIFNAKHSGFGSHEIFHLFVMGGSFCHFVFMYAYVASMTI